MRATLWGETQLRLPLPIPANPDSLFTRPYDSYLPEAVHLQRTQIHPSAGECLPYPGRSFFTCSLGLIIAFISNY